MWCRRFRLVLLPLLRTSTLTKAFSPSDELHSAATRVPMFSYSPSGCALVGLVITPSRPHAWVSDIWPAGYGAVPFGTLSPYPPTCQCTLYCTLHVFYMYSCWRCWTHTLPPFLGYSTIPYRPNIRNPGPEEAQEASWGPAEGALRPCCSAAPPAFTAVT